MPDIDRLSIDAIRMLGMDAINEANSGHPGMVLGSAPTIHILFSHFLNATPKKSDWINRDRFVLASGHASMLLYAILHMCGYKISIDDIKKFRRLNSLTPGHPEYGLTDGVDCGSGPLGQGIAHAVGMAGAEAHLAAIFNRDGYPIIDHYTYALCGDGDMEEGVTQEAISLAGHLKLRKLIVFYDSNDVTLDGRLSLSFNENVKNRFLACGWNVLEVKDANNFKDTKSAIKKAKKSDKPTLIIIKSIIGYMSANQNTNKAHGTPIGKEDTARIKNEIGWNYPDFTVPEEVYENYRKTFLKRGKAAYNKWRRTLVEYRVKYPELYREFIDAVNDVLPPIQYPTYEIGHKEATRVSSYNIINVIAKQMPRLIGGSSDVASSTRTTIEGAGTFCAENYAGKNINYGIREFAMSCFQTGMVLHGGIKSFIGSFLVFTDYFKASMRMAALMNLPTIYVLTHDSIAVGEDGPTHQPIEQVSSLRLIPNVVVLRPTDANETALAWRYALENKKGPVCLILSRQDLISDAQPSYEQFEKGAYIVKKEVKKADLTLVATGSEVHLAVEVSRKLSEKGVDCRVVSITSLELFNKQTATFRKETLGNGRGRTIAFEMGSSALWYRYAGKVFGIDRFGKSAKANDIIADYGFVAEKIFAELG